MQGTILLVEDEAAIAAFVQTALEREGFAVEVVEDGQQALARVNQALPDLIILDLMLPGVDGLEVCRAVRRMPTYVPIIMLTARAEDVDKVVGLELGADDYITKPFNTRELIARVRAVLRLAYSRATMEESDRLRIGQLEIDLTGRTVTVGGQPVELTPKEFDLLVLLASHPGRVFGRETLLEKVWGYDYLGDSRTVDVHVQRLRRKLEADPHHPRHLLTVRSIGYKFAREDAYSGQ
jgi:two-component system alkaline phosphatase synthesis response regulator PhoP